MSNISKKVNEVIANVLSIQESTITPDSNIVGDLGADSIDMVDIIMQLEKEFNVNAPRGRDLDNYFPIVKVIVKYIEERI